MNTFELQTEGSDGHLIIESAGQRILIDTGSPVSLGSERAVAINGNEVSFQPDIEGVTINEINLISGLGIDALLGMDFLSNMYMEVGRQAGTVSFHDACSGNGMAEVTTVMMGGIPTIAIGIGGKPMRVFVDTGAKLSYFDQYTIKSHPFLRSEEDFYPGVGKFETCVCNVPVLLGSNQLHLACGSLPGNLAVALKTLGVEGIIGTEFLNYFETIFSFPEDKLLLRQFVTETQACNEV